MPTDDTALEIYRVMHLARSWETRLLRMLDDGLVSGFYHAGRGHEALEVAGTLPLRPDDYLLYDHRGCAHMIAKGMSLVELFGDFLANDKGSTRGLGAGIVHIADPAHGVLGQSGTLGGGHVLAAGAALSARIRRTDQVVVNFFGDGAANRGTFHEAANAAGAWKLPVVYVVQNNGWAISTPQHRVTAVESFAERAAGYGMTGVRVDGMDPWAVHDAMTEAVERARGGGGPTLLEGTVARQRGHYEGDPMKYLSAEEIAVIRATDPVAAMRERLLADGTADATGLDTLERESLAEVERAAEEALTGTLPGRERLTEGVYA
ncbi:pyruvate dehydrogenase E1 component alpha subunit [Jatrophihabitans endophyticus]|uniref:Pyruvate dehydrogenase E1 component alpha subunit n=1 Tax=Jatrophihabitans endophyticus TaxID=1206085 RepID=A0A1M5PXW3_9ACTN|nr:thiamine pyrophosphate-dependent dehydrogenase E1 component subunit alpha [Jatrophihabitans endophyticus]SHH06103.1 pyruvate dehydrogenase E1 component alpha subunit [Jatrophihabitans endophyticus]